MGTSYETVLVAAEFDDVVGVVRATGRAALVVPVVAGRVAVIPREEDWGGALLKPVALPVSQMLHCPVLTCEVFDSDVVLCSVYEDGRPTHRYVSELEMIVEWFEDSDGEFKARLDGKVLPPDQLPKGALGADAAAFAPFAVGDADLGAIDAALRNVDGSSSAEEQHEAILRALGLPVEALTVAFRHVRGGQFADAVGLNL
ncbi:hypothetical protein ACQP2P_00120 [Dactylosporangium sp. CA-139114]|uniref:hypothetical protein n=1 Tax=Dactylosporangium sp. CA-139114 TaxID=3239931 RepID=UPI003D965B2E